MQNLSEKLTNVLQPYVDRGSLVGAVGLVATADEVLADAAVGFADLATGRPMQSDTLFWIASQTKPITAAALMMLVDDGRVRLDAPVSDYLPEFGDVWVREEQGEQDDTSMRLVRPTRRVTVRDTLTHTAGLPFRSALEQPTLDMLPLDLAVRSYAMTPLDRQPGTGYAYSNAGINTAGRIIEAVTGRPYARFLQERLFDPLHMIDTTFWPTPLQQARLAKSYAPADGDAGYEEIGISQLTYPLDDPRRQPMPAGGLFSTAADCARFLQMVLRGGRAGEAALLSPGSIALMTTKQTPPSVPESYGLGWSVGDDGYGHGGAFSTAMTIYPSRGIATVYLVQHAGYIADGGAARDAFETAAKS